jgi:hypothetical protein
MILEHQLSEDNFMGPMDAVQGIKEIAELVKRANDIPLYEKIVTLQGQVVELAEERLELYQQNEELKRKADLKAKITFRNPYYYEDGDDVPLCPNCYATSEGRIRIHLTHPPQDYVGGHGRKCHSCETVFFEGPRVNGPVGDTHEERPYNPLTHGLRMS